MIREQESIRAEKTLVFQNKNFTLLFKMAAKSPLIIKSLVANDVRFPTSLQGDGSDAMHFDPDYSCVYVRVYLESNDTVVGHGHTFTIGRGTEVVKQAVLALAPLVIGRDLQKDIRSNWASFWRSLTSDSQLRWIGPEKGALHLATGALVNALWDLVAKLEGKPLWKLLVDMTPEEIVEVIDFRYITDALSKADALKLLKNARPESAKRESILRADGYPAYTTGVGWTGYGEEKRRRLCREALAEGYSRFKAKVGSPLVAEDRDRLRIIREEIGPEALLAVDANQKWDVQEAIGVMKQLTDFNLLWIEEPTSPDDVLGHLAVSKALAPLKIGVASGEQCANRILFKQFLASGALQFCQIDACRVGGVNEVLSIILLAARFNVPVCPHAGGVGLCELVQHLAMWDYVCVGGSFEGRMIEFVPHLSEHFHHPAVCTRGRYRAPTVPGYGGQMKESSIRKYEYPNGEYWAAEVLKKK